MLATAKYFEHDKLDTEAMTQTFSQVCYNYPGKCKLIQKDRVELIKVKLT